MSQAERGTGAQQALEAAEEQSRWKRLARSQTLLGIVLVLPAVIWVLAIVLYPVVANIALSLGLESITAFGSFTLEPYRSVLSDPAFWPQVVRTAVWTGGNLLLIVPAGLGIALLLNQDLKGIRHIRTWILLPWMFPVVIVVLIWRWLLEPNIGVINYVLQGIGLIENPIEFLSQDLAMMAVIVTNAWRWIPFVAVVMLAALQNVPQELHDAAATDGAHAFQRFRHVTLPQILPALVINTFLLTMWLFNMFPPIWLMTRGGPGDATTTLPIGLYQTAFELFDMERAAVLAVVLFVFVLAVSAMYWALARRQLTGK